jgi:hypothetical protein
LKRLRGLPKPCRPTGWNGTIGVFEVEYMKMSQVVKPTNKFSDRTQEKGTNQVSRWGAMRYGPKPTAMIDLLPVKLFAPGHRQQLDRPQLKNSPSTP